MLRLLVVLMFICCINAQNCKINGTLNGQCKDLGDCPPNRETGQNPECVKEMVCCEVQAEDLNVNPYGRIARKACQQFTDTLFTFWQNSPYVFGGMDARAKEFTFMAALGYGPSTSNISYFCGGTLISNKHVITAAHCLWSPEAGPVRYVVLGDLDLGKSTDDAQPQGYYVVNVSQHPQYRKPSVYHDIAILELDRPVNFTEYIKPACLDFGQRELTNQTSLYATGWGYIDKDGGLATHLQEVELVEYEYEKCKGYYTSERRRLANGVQTSQICAGGRYEKKDTCKGDSGGPLTRTNKSVRYNSYKGYILIGVTSFGKLCGYTDAPGVYTKIYSYIPWIESIVWPEEFNEQNAIPNRFLAGDLDTPDEYEIPTTTSQSPSVRQNKTPIPFFDVHYFSDK